MTHHRRVVTSEDAPAAVGPYVHGIASNGLLFCSGQVPLDPETGELIEGDARRPDPPLPREPRARV